MALLRGHNVNIDSGRLHINKMRLLLKPIRRNFQETSDDGVVSEMIRGVKRNLFIEPLTLER